MKVFLVAVLVTLAVYVSGERCLSNKACHDHGITHCSGGTHVVCSNGQCECTDGAVGGKTCTAQSDCMCDHGNPHCIDGRCHCTRI